MVTAWALFFCGILCLMFIGMIYGDQFSLISLFEGRWLDPIVRLIRRAGEHIAQAVDLSLQFVEQHSSWVLATVSGSLGLFIVAFLMFSGMADDAAATHRDFRTPLLVGGTSVIDGMPTVKSAEGSGNRLLAGADADDAEFMIQQPGGPYLVFNRPEYDPPLVMRRRRRPNELPEPRPEQFETLDRPALELAFRRVEVRSQQFEDDRQSRVVGRLIDQDSFQLAQLIRTALRSLPGDDWQRTYVDGLRDPVLRDRELIGVPGNVMRESSFEELQALEAQSNVRIVPGDIISESDLRIEKTLPEQSAGQELTVDISIVNVGKDVVGGLLIREFLPRNTQVLATEPNGVYRDDTITWLLDDLRPFEERSLKFTVRPPLTAGSRTGSDPRRSRFESVTEASAVTAVTSRIVAREPERRSPVRPLPFITQKPELQMRIDEPLNPVQVGDVIEVIFVVRNVGNAPAEGVGLRVVLDQGLRHHRLTEDTVSREVVNGVQRLEPGETRRIALRIKATRTGEFLSRAEMVFEGSALTRDTFRVVAEQMSDPLPASPVIR